MKLRPTMTHKFISGARDKNNNSIHLFKLFKKINAFETKISYCVDFGKGGMGIDNKKYFADNLIDAEKLIEYLKEGGK
tara:strand:- start:158 stop:391 length:234 start_codon:yes stop_codon:yes gene_type:complete